MDKMISKSDESSYAEKQLAFLVGDIGARGSTTDQEKLAARYIKGKLESNGLEVNEERFVSPKSGWRPFFLASLIGLIAIYLEPRISNNFTIMLSVVMLATTISVILEMHFQPNLLRLLIPKGKSQNIWARLESSENRKRTLLLVAHIDTHRTPFVFTSQRLLKLFQLATKLGMISFLLVTILFLLAGISIIEIGNWVKYIFGPIFLLLIIITIQPDLTSHTQGANDNASGISILLSLANQLSSNPLKNTSLIFLFTGCEEVGSYGIQDYINKHWNELSGLKAINIDNVAGRGAGVCYLTSEGMIVPFKSSKELLSVANKVKTKLSSIQAYSKPFSVLHTDGTCLMLRGIPTLSFIGMTKEGIIPNWHQKSDTFENIDLQMLSQYEKFILSLLRLFDQSKT